jgi:peptidoglycan biosynthesis protein MviN/MurJ (putative lipid II flippase)
MALAIPALLGLFWLGRPTTRILFEHGRFVATEEALTHAVLTVYVDALPAHVAMEGITRFVNRHLDITGR